MRILLAALSCLLLPCSSLPAGESRLVESAQKRWAADGSGGKPETLLVTLPQTHDVVVKALITASKDKANYGVSQLARQQVRIIDLKAAEEAGVK